MNMKRKVAALALSGAVAAAGAAGLLAVQALAPSGTDLLPQAQAASKKTVYVMTSSKATGTKKVKYTYRYGLLMRAKGAQDLLYAYDYSPNNYRLHSVTDAKQVAKGRKGRIDTVYRGKQGRVWYITGYHSKRVKALYRYNSKGQVTLIRVSHIGSTSYKYFIKGAEKGLLSNAICDDDNTQYTYDEHGFLIKEETLSDGAVTYSKSYTNTYDPNGNLIKRTETTDTGKTTTKYTYKKVKVAKKYAETAIEQQKALVDPEVHFAFPVYGSGL